MAQTAVFKAFLTIISVVLLAGCSTAQKPRLPDDPDPIVQGEATKENVERALEAKVTKQMLFLEQNKAKVKGQVVSTSSSEAKYHFKYYDEFPEGPENIDIVVKPLETINPSYRGEVKYRKIRYQTRLDTSSSEAARDEDFIRDEGVQKEVYEFDGSVWQLKSSTFEVRKTSVYGEDKWRAARGRIRRIEEEEPELFVDKLRNLFGLLD